VRPVAAHVALPPRVLLVSRQPQQQKPASSFYLEQALRVVVASAASEDDREKSDQSEKSVQRIQPQRVEAAQWPAADLFVLDHAGSLDGAALEHIALRVRRGGALLYLTGELADGINLRSMAASLGSGFQPPVELVPPSDGAIRKDMFVSQLRSRDPPFRVFGDSASAVMRTARFGGGLATRKTKEGLQDQILASLSDLSALMYVTA
jgi:hypothetical protein